MKKTIVHLIILILLRNRKKSRAIVNILFDIKEPQPKVGVNRVVAKSAPYVQPTKTNDKKQEILDAIQYIKSKPRKTKADKDKLHLLEVVLKSV